jgi:hypothetical protein
MLRRPARCSCRSLSATIVTLQVFTALSVTSYSAAETPTSQTLQHERLVVVPEAPARQGVKIAAILHVHNPSDRPLTETVEVKVAGETHAQQRVTVPAQSRIPVRLPLDVELPGVYEVSSAQLKQSLRIYQRELGLDEQFEAARRRHRRIIYNNDGGDALYHRDIHTVLDVSTSGLRGSHVDTISYCTVGGLTFWHDSHTGQVIDRGVYDALKKTWGKDPLDLQVDFARENGIEIFWSMRMNDTHDQVDVWNWMMPQWKRDNPELLVGKAQQKYPWGAGNWTALDYRHASVRDYIYKVVEDVANRYAVDGIELDFYRGEPYFKEQLLGEEITDAQREQITDLMRECRQMFLRESRRRDRPLLLAVRVPDSLAYARDIGLDVEQWLEEGLVDVLIVGGDHRYEPWSQMVRLAKKHNRPVYACLAGDYLTQEESDWQERWRGEALNAWDSDVSGIYTFNFMQHHHPLFRQMGDPEVLRSTDTIYEFTPGTVWGFLKNELDYISAVQIEPLGGPLLKSEQVNLRVPTRFKHDIYYTTDGSEPTTDSSRYRRPIASDHDFVLKTRSFGEGEFDTPIVQQSYRIVSQRFHPQGAKLPLDFFGLPNGAELEANFDLPEIAGELQPLLFLSMMDIDAPQESTIFINGKGPLLPPVEIVNGAMTKSAYLPIPEGMLMPGKNVVTFRFDNMNEGTSGFRVYRVEVVTAPKGR